MSVCVCKYSSIFIECENINSKLCLSVKYDRYILCIKDEPREQATM